MDNKELLTWPPQPSGNLWRHKNDLISRPLFIPWSQCKKLCESFRFFLTKADAAICIGHLLVAYGQQIGRRKVFLKTFSNGWSVHIWHIHDSEIRGPQESFWFSFLQNDIECWEPGRVMYVTLTEGACLLLKLTFQLFVLYLLITFSWNSRERNTEAQMSSNSVSMHF